MIGLGELTAGIARYLTEKTGWAAGNDRAPGPEYPYLLVEGESKSAGIIACGRQVERQVTVRVTCWPSRQRERQGGMDMADRVYGLLAAGFTACGRGFCPKEAAVALDGKERAGVTMLLEFCDLPEAPKNETTATQLMGSLALRVGHGKEET